MAKPSREIVRGLLSPPPRLDPVLQRLHADILRGEIKLAYLQKASDISCACTNWDLIERERELRLIDFALIREIDLGSPHWRHVTLSVAAFEHPKLKTGTRGRGRPKKSVLAGLLMSATADYDSEDADAYQLVERIKKFMKDKHGETVSDRRAAGLFVLLQSRENEVAPITRDSPLFESRQKQVCNKVSRHRSHLRKTGKLSR